MKRYVAQLLSMISPTLCTYLRYFACFRKFPNLSDPQNLNEKLQYLKLNVYSKNELVTKCVDKLAVKEYLHKKGFSEIVPKVVGAFSTVENFFEKWTDFPKAFVIKCNHGSGYNIIIKDKSKADKEIIFQKLKKWMNEDYWKIYCEPQYRYVKKTIFVEEFLGDSVVHYQFFCFHGKPEFFYTYDSEEDEFVDHYDIEWNKLPVVMNGYERRSANVSKSSAYDRMVEIAKELSKEFPFVRIDLFDRNGEIAFSEFTFVPMGGMIQVEPLEVLDEWGKLLNVKK